MQQTAGEGWGDAEICRFLLGTNAAQLHGTYLPMWFMQRNHANKYKAALAVENERNLPDGRKNIPFQPPGSRAPPPPPPGNCRIPQFRVTQLKKHAEIFFG